MPHRDVSRKPRASSEMAVASACSNGGSQLIEAAKLVGKLVARTPPDTSPWSVFAPIPPKCPDTRAMSTRGTGCATPCSLPGCRRLGSGQLGLTAEDAELVAFRVGEHDPARPVRVAPVGDGGGTEREQPGQFPV